LTSLRARLFTKLTDVTAHTAELSWPAAFSRVEDFDVRQHKDGVLWSPVILQEDEERISNRAVALVTALVYDLDVLDAQQLASALQALLPYEYAVHTSWKHTTAAPRARVVLPLAEPVTPDVHRSLWEWGHALLLSATGASVDVACKDAARRYFYPSTHPDRLDEAFAAHNPGTLLRPEAVLSATRKPATSPATSTPSTTPATRTGLFSEKADAQRRAAKDFAQDKDAHLIETQCAFLAAARDLAPEQIKEPEWHAALSIWLRCKDGDALAHERSRPDPRYTFEDTQRKLDHLRRASADNGIGPATCSHIRGLASPENRCANACGGCRLGAPLGPIRSPIVLGLDVATATATAERARERVADLDDAIANADTPEERKALRAERKEANDEAKATERAAARAAVLAPAATTNTSSVARIFARGDHAELALTLVGDLQSQAGGPSPVYHAGHLFLHDPATGMWNELPEHVLQQRVTTYAGIPVAGPKPAPLRVNRHDQTGVASMVAAAIRTVSPDPLPMSEGAAFQDGILLADGTFRAYVPGDYVLTGQALPVRYLDAVTSLPPPAPARWLRFLHEVYAGEPDIKERIAVVQEFLGAALFGVATRYQRSLVLLGETGANGKSVLLKVVGRLFPKDATGAITPHHLEGRSSEYYRAMLLRLRINIVSELPEHELMDTSTLKAVIAGDEVIAREIRESPVRGNPRAAWIIAANALPPVRDTSGGFWRRQLAVTHNVRFDGKGNNPVADPYLAERIIATELPGIAAWAAEGGQRLLANNAYTPLASSDALVDAWARDSDPMRRFVEEHLVADPACVTSARSVYAAFKSWAQDNGNSAPQSARLFRRLPTFGFRSVHTKGGNAYQLRIVNLPGFGSASTKPLSATKIAEA